MLSSYYCWHLLLSRQGRYFELPACHKKFLSQFYGCHHIFFHFASAVPFLWWCDKRMEERRGGEKRKSARLANCSQNLSQFVCFCAAQFTVQGWDDAAKACAAFRSPQQISNVKWRYIAPSFILDAHARLTFSVLYY